MSTNCGLQLHTQFLSIDSNINSHLLIILVVFQQLCHVAHWCALNGLQLCCDCLGEVHI